MDLLGSITGNRLFNRDVPKIADSLERIADILSRLEQLLVSQAENAEKNQILTASAPAGSGTPPWEEGEKTTENGDN